MKEIKILFIFLFINLISFCQNTDTTMLEYKTYLGIKINNFSDNRYDISSFFYPISNTGSLDFMFALNDFNNRIILSQDISLVNDLNYSNNSQFMIDSLNSLFKTAKIIYSTAEISISMVLINAKIGSQKLKRQECVHMKLNFINNKLEISYEEVKGITILTKLIF